MNNIIKIDNLSQIYENNEGIRNISFSLEPGDFLAIIGKSGAGKSTLINSILGILKPTQGAVLVDDNLYLKDISFSPQNQAIDWYLNVFDNVYMGALFENIKNPKEKTIEILRKVGLEDKAQSDPTDLSGGQLQRVQLARQLVSDAKILILDEPTSSLDVISSEMILDTLKSRLKEGDTCLISSHDLDMLERYCNKVLFIEEGKQKFFGTMKEFMESYSSVTEYTISYAGTISEKLEERISENYTIINLEPLCVTLKEDQDNNELLELLMREKIKIYTVEKNMKSLKEIVRNRG